MTPIIIIGLLAGVPLLLGLLLRVHTSALFISVASGYLLSMFVGETAGLVSRSFITNTSTAMVTKMVVFLLPIAISMWILRKGLNAAQMVPHFLPLVGCSALILVLGLPLLPPATQTSVYSSFPGDLIKQMSDAIVGIAVALQLILMWITARPIRPKDVQHGRHHK